MGVKCFLFVHMWRGGGHLIAVKYSDDEKDVLGMKGKEMFMDGEQQFYDKRSQLMQVLCILDNLGQ